MSSGGHVGGCGGGGSGADEEGEDCGRGSELAARGSGNDGVLGLGGDEGGLFHHAGQRGPASFPNPGGAASPFPPRGGPGGSDIHGADAPPGDSAAGATRTVPGSRMEANKGENIAKVLPSCLLPIPIAMESFIGIIIIRHVCFFVG